MAQLKHNHQVFIIRCLAQFMSPTEAAEVVKEEFGIEIGRQQVRNYNPEQNDQIAAKWRELFEIERKKFLAELDAIPASNQAYRLKRLDEMVIKALRVKNYPLAAQLLEQAAKERGGFYTNRREVTGKDGGPIEFSDLRAKAQELAERFGGTPEEALTELKAALVTH